MDRVGAGCNPPSRPYQSPKRKTRKNQKSREPVVFSSFLTRRRRRRSLSIIELYIYIEFSLRCRCSSSAVNYRSMYSFRVFPFFCVFLLLVAFIRTWWSRCSNGRTVFDNRADKKIASLSLSLFRLYPPLDFFFFSFLADGASRAPPALTIWNSLFYYNYYHYYLFSFSFLFSAYKHNITRIMFDEEENLLFLQKKIDRFWLLLFLFVPYMISIPLLYNLIYSLVLVYTTFSLSPGLINLYRLLARARVCIANVYIGKWWKLRLSYPS